MMKKTLLLLHCLLPGGAINAALALAEELQKMDYALDVISCNDGPVREKFEAVGISVAIYENVTEESFFTYMAEHYQEVIVNTLLLYPVVSGLNQNKVKVDWWIHEPPMYFRMLGEEVSKPFWDELGDTVTVYAAGDFVGRWIRDSYGCECSILNFGIRDAAPLPECEMLPEFSSDKITFLIPSVFIQYVKGHDLMAEAILGLPPEYAERAEFLFLGAEDATEKEFYELVFDKIKSNGNIKICPPMKQEFLLNLMKQADCIVAPSREDATNACIVEGLMLSKLCLCSNAAGISWYMEDCVNGFIFQSGNIEDLRARIMLVIDNAGRLDAIGVNGRKVYEQEFSMEVFAGNVRKYW